MPLHSRPFRIAGLVVWLAVGIPVIVAGADAAWRMAVWLVAYAAFAAAFVLSSRPALAPRVRFAFFGTEVAAVTGMVLLLCNGFEGTLLVLVASQLGLTATRRMAIPWIAVQNVMLFSAIAIHWSVRPAVMLTPPYLGFQIFAFFAFDLLQRESAVNAQLRALQSELADQARLRERLRISQELHDALGHHLTAMALNLEVAAHQTEGEARENVRTAQSLTRLVLSDVREIVAASEPATSDLSVALARIAAEIPSPRIHLTLPPTFDGVDADRRHALLRCTQEIITNAMRHANAENLWIEMKAEGGSLRIEARDDGRGSGDVQAGRGLSGMRRRLADLGGSLDVTTTEGGGFHVTAQLPATGAA